MWQGLRTFPFPQNATFNSTIQHDIRKVVICRVLSGELPFLGKAVNLNYHVALQEGGFPSLLCTGCIKKNALLSSLHRPFTKYSSYILCHPQNRARRTCRCKRSLKLPALDRTLQCPLVGGSKIPTAETLERASTDTGAELSLEWARSYLIGAHEILQVQGRNLHTLTLPLGC